jgi:hypothetical protein
MDASGMPVMDFTTGLPVGPKGLKVEPVSADILSEL